MTWPAEWPADVVDSYLALARQHAWSPATTEAVAANAQYIRSLALTDLPRQHFAGDFDGERWLFETVEDRGELVVIRQVCVDADNVAHRYSWQRLEDDTGGLTDQVFDPKDGPPTTTASTFNDAWSAR